MNPKSWLAGKTKSGRRVVTVISNSDASNLEDEAFLREKTVIVNGVECMVTLLIVSPENAGVAFYCMAAFDSFRQGTFEGTVEEGLLVAVEALQ